MLILSLAINLVLIGVIAYQYHKHNQTKGFLEFVESEFHETFHRVDDSLGLNDTEFRNKIKDVAKDLSAFFGCNS